MKKSFLIYIDNLNVLDDLTDEEAGKLFKAIKLYQLEKKIELKGLLRAVFIPFKTIFDKNEEQYQNVCKRNRENGSKGGRPKTQENPKNPVGFLETQENPKNLDNDNDNDNDNDILINNNNIPTKEEILNYTNSLCKKIDVENFIAYYEASGWCDKNGLPINWKQKAITWANRYKEPEEDEVDRKGEIIRKLEEKARKAGKI